MTIDVTVSMAFDGSTWQTPRASMTWTDVSPFVSFRDGMEITRGRTTARDEMRTGSCSFTLIDDDRTFDPENAAGPYYGFLTPGVPVKVTASVSSGAAEDLFWDVDELFWDVDPLDWGGAASYDRFFGFVEDFPNGSLGPADQRLLIPIVAHDALGMLAAGRQPSSVLSHTVTQMSPVAFWPLDETGGDVMWERVDGFEGTYSPGTTALSETVTNGGVSLPGIDFDGSHYGFVKDKLARVLTRPLSVTMIVSPPDETTVVTPFYAGDGTSIELAMLLDNNSFSGVLRGGPAPTLVSSTDVELADGGLHLLAFRALGSGAGQLFFDGELVTDFTSTPAVSGSAKDGTWIGGIPNHYYTMHEGFLSSVAVWDRAVSIGELAAIYAAAVAPLDGQTTDERIDWILDRAGFPSADRNLTVGYTGLGPAVLDSQFTLDLIRRIEQTEQGRFFISTAGDATFHARYHGQLVASSSSATFADDGTDVTYADVEVSRLRRFVFNKVTVSADGLSAVTVEDAASIAAHGERAVTIDAPLLQAATAQQSLGEYVLANSKDTHLRVFGLTVPLHRDFATLAPLVLPLELADRVTFERTPLGTGAAISAAQTVEGYTERFDTKQWWWTPHLSPAEPVTFATWDGTGDAHEWDAGVWGY